LLNCYYIYIYQTFYYSQFFYGDKSMKSKFVNEQSVLVQALDEFKRKARNTFLGAGLDEYWKIHPESIRLGSRPCFEVMIRQRNTEFDQIVPLDNKNFAFLQRNPFITKYDSCKSNYIMSTYQQ